jgi:hypothetical protein
MGSSPGFGSYPANASPPPHPPAALRRPGGADLCALFRRLAFAAAPRLFPRRRTPPTGGPHGGRDSAHCRLTSHLGGTPPAPPPRGARGRRGPTLSRSTRRIILQKARRQLASRRSAPRKGRRHGQHQPSTACWYRGSGSLSFPCRGAFHLSLTVLVPYRWPGVRSLGGWSPLLPTGFRVSRGTQGAWCPQLRFASSPTGLSPSVVGLPRPFGCRHLPTPGTGRVATPGAPAEPYNPVSCTAVASRLDAVWAQAGSLATTTALSYLISSPRGTLDVSVPAVPLVAPMHSAPDTAARTAVGCPIRSRPAQRLHAAPRSRFAALRVLLRLQAPRHPPCTSLRLAIVLGYRTESARSVSNHSQRALTQRSYSFATAKSK